MEKNQEVFIKSKNSDYLHDIVQKKDWKALIELASSRDAYSSLISEFFRNDESKPVLKEMTEEQILTLIDTAPSEVSNNILDRMESLCDTDSKFTDIAVKLMKGVFLHGGILRQSSIIKCLPINILRVIIDSRIPQTEFHFGTSHQEFFKHINTTLQPNSTKDYSYKNLKERDCKNGVFIYIQDELNSFPLGRREVYKEAINALRDSFTFIESNNNIDPKLPFIRDIIINPFIELISRGLQDEVLDYRNDKELIEELHQIFEKNHHSKYYRYFSQFPILTDSGNASILTNSDTLEDCKIISPNFFYKVFKKSVEENEDNFIDSITRGFFNNCRIMHHIRELNDGVYDKLFNATIEMTVREIIERKQSENFNRCCNLLRYSRNKSFNDSYNPRFDECLSFVKDVISGLFDKAQTLNVDVLAYPEICCYLLNTLNGNVINLPIPRDANSDVTFSIQRLSSNNHTVLDLLDVDMRNKLVLGVIRHPTDNTKFSHIITSNNPTTFVNFICNLHSVQDIKLILPEGKRNTIDKYGFRESRSARNPKESCKMNLVEIFLQTLRFWENNDKSLFRDGYIAYYQFVRKILIESILTKNQELKKEAIGVYHRFAELVSLMNNAKFINTRIQIASVTFLSPIAVIVGSELDKSFVEQFVQKYIQPFNAQSYQAILSEVISKSHLNLNYYDDEKDEIDNEIDKMFREFSIDEEMAKATSLLLGCIKQNPVKNFNIYYNSGVQDNFFISEKRVLTVLKKKFEILNPKIIDVCNPLKTEYPLNMAYNNPRVYPVLLREPQYKMSDLVFLELCRFVADEIKDYSPKTFKSNLTKSLIKIQKLIIDITRGCYDVFQHKFFLDQPTFDTSQDCYNEQSRRRINVLYSKSFFNFLNEINQQQHSIYNDESYEIVKNAIIAQFLNEEDYLQQKNKPPPKFNGFDILIQFENHQNAENIFNTTIYYESIKSFKLSIYQKTNQMNQNLINFIERSYNNTKLLDDHPFEEVFKPDLSTHKSHELSQSQHMQYYSKNAHKCFTTLINALNKSNAELFANEFDSLEKLQNFTDIKDYGSSSNSYTMLTQLLDLLINDFVSTNTNLNKMYKNRIATYNDIYRFMNIVAKIASPNIGTLNNLDKLCSINERTIAQKVPSRNPDLFDSIFKNEDINQIIMCMNSSLFSSDATNFHGYLSDQYGLVKAKQIIDTLINEILNNGKQVIDDFLVSLASCCIHPKFVGFPIPQNSLDYLKKITNKSIYAKRAACANAVYYAIMCHTADVTIPLKDILEIIESAHKKSPDEITAFFCILISEMASLGKMNSLPALNDLMSEYALPSHYIINQVLHLNIPKEIGDLYYKVIEKVILSGLKSKKSHIYELTVTVLNEINVGPEIHEIISPFIEKGLKEIEPSDDNEAFLRYATSFTMKNPEFKGCFESYCEALAKIKKHSYAILKANSHLKKDSPYPEPFTKLENSYSTIINTIEKPFEEFKEENEMIPTSQFCRKLLPILKQNRPAVARDVYLLLEAYVSIFADPLIEEMVHLYKQDKKEESLSKFIVIVTHHEEIAISLPQSIRCIYHHLNSTFTVKHSIELSKNLRDSQTKLSISMQRAHELAELISPDVLAHMPNSKSLENGSEDEIVQILSNLGIFSKKNEVVLFSKAERRMNNAAPMHQAEPRIMRMPTEAPAACEDHAAFRSLSNVNRVVCESKAATTRSSILHAQVQQQQAMVFGAAVHLNAIDDACHENEEQENICDNDNDVECFDIDISDDADGIDDVYHSNADEDDDGEKDVATEENSTEKEGEGELNQDQINDAFDLFF